MDWNNLMMYYNATLRQDVEMVNTNNVFNVDDAYVGNNDEVNWCEKKLRMPKPNLQTHSMLKMVFFRVIIHKRMIITA